MQEGRIRGAALALLLVLVLGLAACQDEPAQEASSAAAEPSPGGTVVVALADEPDVLNSLIRTSAVAGTVLSLISSGLAELMPDESWEPRIAASWEIAPDGRAITYRLRPWRWEDDEALTAADVRLSWQLLVDPRVGSPRRDLLANVTAVVVVDPATVRYELAQAVQDPVQATAHAILPAHRLAGLDPTQLETWPTNRQPLACGPFRLVRWEAGTQLVLERNPCYPLQPALLDRVVLRILPDETARVLALEAGDVDVVADLPPASAKRLAGSENVVLHEVTGRVFGFVMWNVRRAQLAAPAVRRALSLAIDRQRFVDDLLGGFAVPATSYLPPALWNHDAELAPDPFRPDSARAILTRAGWTDRDGDGVRENDGRPLRLEILYRGGDDLREAGATVLQQNLAAVGVDVRLRALELATAIEFLREGRFDAYWGEFQANVYADPSALIRSGATDQLNYGGYANARVDSLLEVALATSDRELARPCWQALQAELAVDQPAALIYYPRQIVATSRRLRDATPDLLSPLNRLERWWIAPADRRWQKQ